MNESNQNSRRKFIGALAIGATTGIAALTQPLQAGIRKHATNIGEADQWFRRVKGAHRIVFDGAEPNNAFPIIWTWAFYQTNNQTNSPDEDLTAVCVLRHNAIAFALNDALWKKYKLGEFFNIKDNTTGAPALRNPYYEPRDGDYPFPGVDGIKGLQKRGAMFCACNLALSVYSGFAASKTGQDPEKVRQEWVDAVLPEVQIVPSGVWALGRAQEHGCQYVFAG